MQLHHELLELGLKEAWSTARTHANRTAQVIIVTLTDDDGVIGLGEAAPISRYGESPESVAAFLNRIEPSCLNANDVRSTMACLGSVSAEASAAKSAVNCALMDLAARRVDQPLHEYLGLGFREGRHLTSFSIGIDTPGNIQRKVQAAEDFPVLKIKLGSTHDDAILAAVRKAAPDKTIRVDANEGWATREQALSMIDSLAEDGRIELVEQPMPANASPEDLAWLKQRSPLPLFADESLHTVADVPPCAEGFHGVNIKLSKTAGITGAVDALNAARAAGLKTMIGCMVESSVGITAAAHLAELAEYLDLDGNLLIENDPFEGVKTERGCLSFAPAARRVGLMVQRRT